MVFRIGHSKLLMRSAVRLIAIGVGSIELDKDEDYEYGNWHKFLLYFFHESNPKKIEAVK